MQISVSRNAVDHLELSDCHVSGSDFRPNSPLMMYETLQTLIFANFLQPSVASPTRAPTRLPAPGRSVSSAILFAQGRKKCKRGGNYAAPDRQGARSQSNLCCKCARWKESVRIRLGPDRAHLQRWVGLESAAHLASGRRGDQGS